MRAHLSILPKSIGPTCVSIFVPTIFSLLLSSSSSVKPSANVTFLIPVGTFNGIQILIFATGSLRTDPLNPPIINTFPCRFDKGSFIDEEGEACSAWEEEGVLDVFVL